MDKDLNLTEVVGRLYLELLSSQKLIQTFQGVLQQKDKEIRLYKEQMDNLSAQYAELVNAGTGQTQNNK